jgi:hypothetical protein
VKERVKMDVKLRRGVLGVHKNVQLLADTTSKVVKIIRELGLRLIVLNKFVKPL